VPGDGCALPGLLNNVPEHVGPVSAAPPGVKAGAVWFGAVWWAHPGPLPHGHGEKTPTFLVKT
ncbi:hypothetical protein ACVGWM_00640, partial [Enterobacter hormaechei]